MYFARTAVFLCFSNAVLFGSEPVTNEEEPGGLPGRRPYEMVKAGRDEPAHDQWVDFENLKGWRLRCRDGAQAKAYRSRRELLFGAYTARVVYTGISERSRFVLIPPEPMSLPSGFDSVDLWVRGNNWGWMRPPRTAPTTIALLLREAGGEIVRVEMGRNDFDYWHLLHAPLVSPTGAPLLFPVVDGAQNVPLTFPAMFEGIEVSGCSSFEPAAVHFDALSFYRRKESPLSFRSLPDSLSWPTTPDTLLPSVKDQSGPLPSFTYEPSEGTLTGLYVTIEGQRFQPCLKGGIRFVVDGMALLPGDPLYCPKLLGQRKEGDRQRYDYRLSVEGRAIDYTLWLETKGKSCVIDVEVRCTAGVQLDVGLVRGLPGAKTVFFPYLVYSWDGWPRVVCGQGDGGPIFLLSLLDHYISDASEFFGPADLSAKDALGYCGGARYHPTTQGERNPIRERLFVNVSTDVQEVLPNIPNPPCDTGSIARECLANNLGDGSYPFPYERLRNYKAYGIDKYVVNLHECAWRSEGESFTLRQTPAPKIGTDALAEFGAFVKSLGYRFGLYSNYTDIAPVNAHWNENHVCLNPDGSWKKAWPRTYALKPLRAAEMEADLAPRLHERYGTSASCIDVHTALTPWERTDYDARTPGAAKFRTQFDSFSRVLLNESKAHHGPAISEGNFHWFYAGLADGNYATILPFGEGYKTPPLVDFDLLKMHPKMTDLGVGSPFTFYGYTGEWNKGASRLSESFRRFVTATIAYGHMGYLAESWGVDGTLKCYYLLQALQQRYLMVPVRSIQYFNGEDLMDTSSAIATDAYKRGQVRTEYENGLVTWCNLSFSEEWPVCVAGQDYQVPPAGFVAHRPEDILVHSATVNGQFYERVSCEDYLYLDGHDQFVKTPEVQGRGTVAVRRGETDTWWVIPALEAEDVGVSLAWLGEGDSDYRADACDRTGRAIKETDASVEDGILRVSFVPDASVVKYRIRVRPTKTRLPFT